VSTIFVVFLISRTGHKGAALGAARKKDGRGSYSTISNYLGMFEDK